MLNNQTVQTLRSLKLTGMAEGLEQQQAQPSTHEELGFDEAVCRGFGSGPKHALPRNA